MKLESVLFDLDGTLTKPYLDFDRIRSEIGGISGPILEALERMGQAERARAEAILERHEREAAEHSELNAGAGEVMLYLRSRGLKVGLVTRNNRESTARICRTHGLWFDRVVSREDGPVKPDPFPVLLACKDMQVSALRSVMVGDYLFDLQSGQRAGAKSVLYSNGQRYQEYWAEADYVIRSLMELPGILETIEREREHPC